MTDILGMIVGVILAMVFIAALPYIMVLLFVAIMFIISLVIAVLPFAIAGYLLLSVLMLLDGD